MPPFVDPKNDDQKKIAMQIRLLLRAVNSQDAKQCFNEIAVVPACCPRDCGVASLRQRVSSSLDSVTREKGGMSQTIIVEARLCIVTALVTVSVEDPA